MKLIDGNSKARILGLEELPARSNYFIGSDPRKWHTDVRNYAAVKYEEVYPGVDLIFYGNQGELEYDFMVKPGADPNQICLAFSGADKLSIEKSHLVLKTAAGTVQQRAPTIYQFVKGVKHDVRGQYVLLNEKYLRVRVDAYDSNEPLIIDPVLSYSSYLGGTGTDEGNGIALDGSGNIYLVGTTSSTDFPVTSDSFQRGPRDASSSVFVTKLNPTGSLVIYSTYLGGTGVTNAYSIAVDRPGNAYVTGETASKDFPTANPIQANNRGGVFGFDAFVAKLNPTGSALIYSTYLGGTKDDRGNNIAVDRGGNVYLTGETKSPDFPTLNAFQPTYGGSFFVLGGEFGDAFVTRINAAGSAIVYSSFLGGKGIDQGFGIALDSASNAYVTGATTSTDFPLARPFQNTPNTQIVSGFVTKVHPLGPLVYSTFLSGSGRGIAVDQSGSAYVVGYTSAPDFPLVNPIQSTLAGQGNIGQTPVDAFITKFNAEGSALLYSTYLGGDDSDNASGVAVDGEGNAYVTGVTKSRNFPVASAIFASPRGGFDAFVAKIGAAGSTLVYSTYLGGSATDTAGGIAVDALGNAYIAGTTSSVDFPIMNRIQASFRGGFGDAFIVKISDAKKLYFAQFGDGSQGTTSIFSQITLVNVDSSAPANTSIEINDDLGNPLAIDLDGAAVAGRKDVIIPIDGSVSLKTRGQGAIQVGSVVVTSDRNISGVILFGGSVGTAGVGDSRPLRKFVAPIETSAGINTGIAIMGLGQDQTVQLELRNADGKVAARTSLRLGAKSHTAKFVTELQWDTPPDFSNFSGTLKATGTSELAATVIRVSPGEFATLPVTEIQ